MPTPLTRLFISLHSLIIRKNGLDPDMLSCFVCKKLIINKLSLNLQVGRRPLWMTTHLLVGYKHK